MKLSDEALEAAAVAAEEWPEEFSCEYRWYADYSLEYGEGVPKYAKYG